MAQYTNPKKKKNNDIAPIRSDVGLFQRADNWNDVDNFWEGVGAFGETALASTADLGVNVVKGAGRLVEGVTDLFGHGIAGLADLLGFDEWSDEFRGYVNDSWVDNLASPADEFLDEYSIFGQTGDAIGEGIGQVAAVIVTGGALGAAGLGTAGVSAATTGIMGASSMGSGMSEAYNAGATDKQALFYGIMKGAIDAGSELLFGGLGKTVNALGISRGLSSLDDIVAKKLSSGISNQFFKNVVQWGVKSSAEGLEEVLAGIGTIAAKKLTYMSDEELGKLIKDENLFQQFIVGAVSAGVTQSGLIPGMKKGSLTETTKKGQDFVSGLTASEQKVADKLFNDLVKQKEADGKKLSGFEKNKIFDSIVEQMESGDIDVETIEDILKEDVYKDNKAKLDEEDALFKEYEELGKKKASNISLAEETRYKELHDKTKELTFRKDLDSRMSEEVYNRVKDSRLASSYADAARRGESFQADVNEYDEAERATIQSAIDAGFLNNTNKTRRLVNWIAKIAAKTGIKVDFTTNEKLKQSGFAIDGKTINGYKTKDGIGINMQSKKVLETVVGHEITHVFEGTELYKEMQKAVYAYAEAKGELSSRREAISKLYNGVTKDIDSELTAELVSEYLFTDQEFINRLANDNRNLFQKMWDEVKYMWSQAHPSSPEAQKLEQLKRVFEETYKSVKDRTITENGIQYAIADSKDITPSKERVDSNIQEVAAMDSVYTVDESKLSPTGKDLKEIYAEYFNEWGGNIHTDVFGDVAVKNSSIRSEIRHGSTAEKIASVEAIPSVLQNGKIVDWIEKEVGVYRIVVAAPIKIGDSPCIMGVMLQRDSQNQRLYLHDVVIEKEAIGSMQDDLVTTGSHKESDSLYTTMILQKVIDVKRNLKNSAENDISVLEGGTKLYISDSNGKELTKGQQEYFKDSKVRDKDGNLKVMYHGTNESFTTFDKSKAKSSGTYGKGFYFTDSDSHASTYGKTYEVYLNIKNPLQNGTNDITKDQLRKFVEALAENEDYGIENYGYDATVDSVTESVYGKSDFGMILDLNLSCVGNMVEAIELFNEVNGTDYDGIIAPTETVAFYPNQIKSVSNENPTTNDDMQFSLSEDTEATPRDVYFGRIDEVYDKLKGKSSGKSHMVDGYNFFLQKNDFDESAYISITTPEGEKLRHIVDGGNQWKNARLWHEAAKMVSNHENPNVATATTQEEAGEYSEIEGKREETKKTFKEKVGDTKTLGRKAVGYLVDKYQPIENLALKTGNRELDAKANTMRTSERAAQHFIGNGADGVRAINDLRQEVEASGLENEFEEYMYDLLTTDRMNLEERAKPIIKKLGDKFKNMKLYQIKALAKKEITQKTTETSAQYIRDAREYLRAISARNKPVRGDFYTADIARAHATELEQKYPQFKQWAEDVYANTNFMLDKLVADGELSQEAADRFRELYPHYVPIRRVNKEGKAVDVPLYSNRTGIDAPIKGATGGDGTIGYLFETLAMRAEQTFLAGAKNRFGIELKNTLKAKTTDAEVDVEDIFEEVDTHEDRLKAGEDGQAPTFTVFENGKRVTFEIPEDIYDALKPTDEFWKQTFAVPNAITKFQRGVLTEYNPFFMARNAVKDFQDVLINSQHAKETYKNFPEAMRQLYAYEYGGEDAQYAKEYFSNGAEDLTYFDGKEKLFDSKNTENPWAKEKNSEAKKIIGFVPSKISQASSFVERVPRLAEYIASRKAGASIDVAMLDAARVTTNFAAGGDVTKFANRNGATFLNASVQGAAQAVRNVREAKAQGLKGMLKLGAKVAIAGIPYLIVNALLWGDDDEYEELSDYIKENYYIVAKYGDGQFVRIPKGRMAAVIQSAFDQMSNLVTGNDEVDFERFGELLVENIAPNNPLENNILAPIMNVAENKTWYGDDLVPQRLQDLPAGEQSDETTDAISKWLGETINVSPYKLNYLLDQYSGVFGDMFLPAMTPQAEGGNSTLLGGMIAPITDQFTTDSTMKNQNVSDFYDTLDDLTASAKSKHATDGDVLRYKYMNAVNSDISALYKQKREIQNSSLSNSVKYERVREIQRQIDELAKQALAAYNGVSVRGNIATIGGYQFKKNNKGEWEKVRESSSSSNWSNDLFDWMSGFSNNFDIPDFNLD